MPENLYTPDSIRTRSGIYFNFKDPIPEMINIEDIAHGLSMLVRFGGHLPYHYSVAQHCLVCANKVEPKHRLAALMHDASEAYLIDVPSPLKNLLPGYYEMEDKIMRMIAEKFGFQYPLHAAVKHMDSLVLYMEWTDIVLQEAEKPSRLLRPMSQENAKAMFLEQYYKLKGE